MVYFILLIYILIIGVSGGSVTYNLDIMAQVIIVSGSISKPEISFLGKS